MELDYRESPESLEHLLESTLDPVYPSSQSPASEIQYCSQHLISEICDIDHPIYWLTDDLKNEDGNYLGCQQHLINSSLALSPISNPKSPGTEASNLVEHNKGLNNIDDDDLYKSSDIDDLEAYLGSLTESQEKDFAKYAQDNLTPPYSHSDVNNNQIFYNDEIFRNDNESLSFNEPFGFIYQPLSPSFEYSSISGQENEVTCESFQIINDDNFTSKLISQDFVDLYDQIEFEQSNNKSITELSITYNITYENDSDTYFEHPKLFTLKSKNKNFTDNVTSCKSKENMDVSYLDSKQSLSNSNSEHKTCAKRRSKSSPADFGTKKKVQNKEAARRYRDKKKARQKSICEEEDDLRKKNKVLKSEVERLTHETNALRRLAYECLGKKGLIDRGIKL